MKISIINAYGRSNRGDSVLLDECISEVRHTFPDAQISCTLFEGSDEAKLIYPNIFWTERIGNARGHSFVKNTKSLIYLLITVLADWLKFSPLLRILPKSQRDTYFSIRSADYIISAPGGYIHDTNFAFYIALLHIYIGVRSCGRVILAPQSIGPIDSALGKWVARFILSKADVCCVRERYSFDFLIKELQIDPDRVKLTGDSAFWDNNVCDNELQILEAWQSAGLPDYQDHKIFGITVVDWSFPKSNDPTASRQQYVKALASTIDKLATLFNLVPVIFNQVSEDLPIALEISQCCTTRVYVDTTSREPEFLRAFISKSTIFLGTRFHSCIFSMIAGVPTVAIAYLPKTSNILLDLNLKDRQVSIDAVTDSTLIRMLTADMANLSSTRATISKSVLAYQETMPRLRDFLSPATS